VAERGAAMEPRVPQNVTFMEHVPFWFVEIAFPDQT
jgi:hypothetical protein